MAKLFSREVRQELQSRNVTKYVPALQYVLRDSEGMGRTSGCKAGTVTFGSQRTVWRREGR